MDKMMIMVVDGCAPEYLTRETAPGLYALAGKLGFMKTVKSAIPSVTNVNHACILSGRFPKDTGVVGNYYYKPETGEEGFIEERGFMRAETILQAYKKAGKKTALLTVKGKVLGVYGDGADTGISVQTPDPEVLKRLGLSQPPKVQSPESTRWILEAALACVKTEDPDLLYCTTNDYVFHHWGPGTAEAEEQIHWLDEYICRIHQADPERRIYITADHGMNQKRHLINFQAMADRRGIRLYCLPPLKDRYIENHIYQEGGILYVFLKNEEEREAFLELAQSTPEIERVMESSQAAEAFHLPAGRIGDYVLLAAEDCAFGEVEGERLNTDAVRTHGSLYEQEIPLWTVHPQASPERYQYSKDIAAIAMGI